MFIMLEVACNDEGYCHPLFVPIDNIYSILQAEDENDKTVKSIVKLTNGDEYKCTSDYHYYHRLLNSNGMLMTDKTDSIGKDSGDK